MVTLAQVNLVVADMDAAAGFYRRLGVAVEVAEGGAHAEGPAGGGVSLELDTAESVRLWDSRWQGPAGGTGSCVLGFQLDSRDAVDRLYDELVAAGHAGHQVPFDAFWGARYAIVDDPDGNPVGLMSPADAGRRSWPPAEPPRA